MKNVQPFWSVAVVIINLLIVLLCVGCGSSPLIQPELSSTAQGTPPNSQTGPTPTKVEQITLQTPKAVTPTKEQITPQVATPLAKAKPLSTEKIQPEVIESTGGLLNLTLSVPDDVSMLESSISKVIYTSTESLDGTSTTIWMADLEDLTQKTELATFSHPRGYPIAETALSPNHKRIAYAHYEGKDPFQATLEVLQLETQDRIQIDPNLFVRLRGGKTILWSPDSSMLAYVTGRGEIYLYHLKNAEKRLVARLETTQQFSAENSIKEVVLIGWAVKGQILYYAMQKDDPQWRIWSVNMETNQREEVGIFNGDLTDASLSPDETKLLLSMNIGCPLLDVTSESQNSDLLALDFACGLYPIWWPDSQGVVGSYGDEIFAVDFASTTENVAKRVLTEVSIPVPPKGFILDWSAAGRYLAYRDRSTKTWRVWVVDLSNGQKQLVPDPYSQIVGWIGEK